MQLRGIAVLATLAVIAGCSDGPTPPVVGFYGALSFTYTGGGGGTHTADGDFTTVTSANLYAQDWAYGARSDEEVVVGIVSNQPRSLTTHDMSILVINRLTTGSSSFSVDCDPEVTDACTGFVFYRAVPNAGGAGYEAYCILTSGSVNLTTISNSRAQGTFNGSGLCFDVDFNDEPFTVTGGTFNVALLSENQVP